MAIGPHPDLSWRQVHLDFHTSGLIPGIGAAWDPERWQQALRAARVASVTCFASCHHGWSYHPTTVGRMHPGLDFDLLRAQLDAAHAIDVKVPVYLTGGIDDLAASEHPEWREVDADGRLIPFGAGPGALTPAFRKLCFNSPYLDHLAAKVAEVCTRFGDADGIFIDIVFPTPCCCRHCLAVMAAEGLDPRREDHRRQASHRGCERYLERIAGVVAQHAPGMPLYHNSFFVRRGWRRYWHHFSHLEVESLPTGGWGYDHFPLTARYLDPLGIPFSGMTGKFHTGWGEHGGFKHPDALRYECGAMLAHGARCSVGDQLHPSAQPCAATWTTIGAAFELVAAAEPFCRDSRPLADVALLSTVACRPEAGAEDDGDTGAVRLLGEGQVCYDIVDAEADFGRYRVLLLPDTLRLDAEAAARVRRFLDHGGSVLACGGSVLDPEGRPWFELGAEVGPAPELDVDYLVAADDLAPDFAHAPMVMYRPARALRVTTGSSLGAIHEPYFARAWDHYSGHQHAPPRPEASGRDAGVHYGRLCYLAHDACSLYRGIGAVALKRYVLATLRRLLPDPLVTAQLPSGARLTLRHQPAARRHVLHLCYAPIHARGGPLQLHGGTRDTRVKTVDLIEELPPLHDVALRLRLPSAVRTARLVPQDQPLALDHGADGSIGLVVPRVAGHQMVALE